MARKKGRKKGWGGMTAIARRRAMPSRGKPKRRYPLGSYVMKDVGKKGGHYQFIKKVRWGWKKVKAPKKFLKAGWKRDKNIKGYVYKSRR